ncbi:methyl-accepting chemotaxis protein [Clostridium lundense]|uniref:methyl-accepting chemotaxis protein n=1 Tax=Clostridium lundense TaxID=319475 RepID=UPI000A968ECA|nr:methyl-accepting chemotaxis protein [Clostridium lundense]
MKNNELSKSLFKSYFIIFIISIISIGIITVTSFLNAKKALTDLGETALRNRAQMGIEFMDALESQVKEGKITREEAEEIFRKKMLNSKQSDGKTRGLNSNLELNIKAYMYAIDSTGLERMHPFKEGENISEVKDAKGNYVTKLIIDEGKNPKNNGIIHFWWKNSENEREKPKVNAVAYYAPWDWFINVGCYYEDFYKPAYKILYSTLIISTILILIMIFLIRNLMIKKINPLNKIIDAIKKMGDGDLTTSLDIDSKDELGYMASILNTTLNEIRGILSNIKNTSNTIDDKVEIINSSINTTSKNSNNIRESMDEISAGIMNTAKDMQVSFEKVTNLGSNIESIKETSLILEKGAKEADSLNSNMIRVLGELQEENIKSLDMSKETTENMEILINKSNTIVDIVNTIEDISGQINLLALNASIESARAGEQGKGFAVVSEEIKNLAEQTAESTKKIGNLINELINAVNQSVDSVKKFTQTSEEQSKIIEETQDTLKKVIGFMQDIPKYIDENIEKIDGTSEEKDLVINALNSVVAVTEQISAAIEEISASIGESDESILSVSNMAEELTKSTNELNEKASSFSI